MFCGSPRRKFALLLDFEDLALIALQGKMKAKKVKSAFRHNHLGEPVSVEVAMAVVEKNEGVPQVFSASADVHPSARQTAEELAMKTLMASADEKAVSSRSMGRTAGAVPLYKSVDGKTTLVGALAVSGDHPDQNEAVVLAASEGFEAPAEIRDSQYSSPVVVEELVVSSLPDLISPVSPLDKLGKSLPPLSASPASASLIGSASLDLERPLPPITPSASLLRSGSPSSLPPLTPTPRSSPRLSPQLSPVSARRSVLPPLTPSPRVSPSSLPPLSASPRLSPYLLLQEQVHYHLFQQLLD